MKRLFFANSTRNRFVEQLTFKLGLKNVQDFKRYNWEKGITGMKAGKRRLCSKNCVKSYLAQAYLKGNNGKTDLKGKTAESPEGQNWNFTFYLVGMERHWCLNMISTVQFKSSVFKQFSTISVLL